MRLCILFVFFSLIVFSQEQIGEDINGLSGGDQSGWSVSISSDGTILAIGANTSSANGPASGQVRVFENQSNNWIQIGNSINGANAGDESGTSVSISGDGDIVAIGSPRSSVNGTQSGMVSVYENLSGVWTLIGNPIEGSSVINRFGTAVSLSLDGTILAVGAPFSNNGRGYVQIYRNQTGNWVQIGDDINGEFNNDFFGTALSLSSDGNTLAVGAPFNSEVANNAGNVKVFRNSNDNWVQIGNVISGDGARDELGAALSLSQDGSILAIGASKNNSNGNDSGQVKVFKNQSDTWVQIGNEINGTGNGHLLGWSVSLSANGNILAASAPGSGSSRGYTKIYKNESGNWLEKGNQINGEATGDFSGRSITLSSDGATIAIGANRNNNDAGHVRVFNLTNILSVNEFVIQGFSMFPNPAKTYFNIQLNNSLHLNEVTIYNHLGQFVLSSGLQRIDISYLESGIYFVNLNTNYGSYVKRLIIE